LRFNFDLENSKSEFPDGLIAYPMPGDARIVE
jgi:hypothetical protein